jgi:rhodanese-related sulfurtransferase
MLRYVAAKDQTAVLIDVRDAEAARSSPVPNARNIPRSGVLEGKDMGDVKRAKDDGRLPMQDHNTRLIVIGGDVAEAKYVAEALVREAFQNLSFFHGNSQEARALLEPPASSAH